MDIRAKSFEIFCGTGGVGKTTMATSRAIYLAQKGKKVLIITIDPARRLKEILSISEERSGHLEKVFLRDIDQQYATTDISVDAVLMSSRTVLERIVDDQKVENALGNEILNILSRPYGGMNEILGLLELHYYNDLNQYDSIILDTPPGNSFIEFVESCQKIHNFFDQNFIDIFQYLKEGATSMGQGKLLKLFKEKDWTSSKKILNIFMLKGINKLLSYLEKITGQSFIYDFINTVGIIYKLKGPFFNSLELLNFFQDSTYSNWFYVTSVEHNKIIDALSLHKMAQNLINHDSYLIINRCFNSYWNDWDKKQGDQSLREGNDYLVIKRIKDSMYNREKKLKEMAYKHFPSVLEFGEILHPSPQSHVTGLCQQWISKETT